MKQKMASENLKYNKNLKINKILNIKNDSTNNINIQNVNQQYVNFNEKSSNIKNQIDTINVDDINELNRRNFSEKKIHTVKFKFREENNEVKPILYSEDEFQSNEEKINDILGKAELKSKFSDKISTKVFNNNKENINNKNDRINSPTVQETEQEYNMIEVNNNPEGNANNYDSPNMIKNSSKFNSNSKNSPHAIEFNAEKNISNTTFRAGSELNKNK